MLYFGTDGIRATNNSLFFSAESLFFLGRAIALWNKNNHAKYNKILCIYDTRASASTIKKELANGLAHEGQALFDGGILPTPAAHWIMSSHQFDLALILTASHNPATDNGIKILLPQDKISRTDEKEIEHHFANLVLRQEKTLPTKKQADLIDFTAQAKKSYLNTLFKLTPCPNLSGKKIIIDCANGAMSSVAHDIFSQTNADTIYINNQPDGTNINANCGAIHPEIIQNATLQNNANIGFSFDGDGDRVIACNQNGTIKTGDDFLALLSTHPQFSTTKEIIGTSMTNQGLVEYAQKNNKKFTRTIIGDRAIIAEMRNKKALLGGEPGGHIIMNPGIPSSDGAAAALWVLDACKKNNNFSFTTFVPYIQHINSITTLHKPDFEQDLLYQKTLEKIRTVYPKGRAVVRYSGTEPRLRIMVESQNNDESHAMLIELTKTFETILFERYQ